MLFIGFNQKVVQHGWLSQTAKSLQQNFTQLTLTAVPLLIMMLLCLDYHCSYFYLNLFQLIALNVLLASCFVQVIITLIYVQELLVYNVKQF